MNSTASRITWGTLLSTLLAAVACSGGNHGSHAGVHVVDSAGVQIVTNSQGTVRGHLVEDLRLGRAEGHENVGFSDIGAIGVDGTGHLYVADRGSATIRVYTREGESVRSIGRRGTEPGEFDPLSSIWVSGEELLALGGSNGPPRLSLFSTDGTFIVSRPYGTRDRSTITPLARAGRFWLIALRRPADPRSLTMGTLHTDSIGIARFLPTEGALHRPFLRFPEPTLIVAPLGRQPTGPLFDPIPRVAVDANGRIIRTAGDRYAVEVFDPDGSLQRRFGRDHEPRTIQQEWLDAYEESVRDFYRTPAESRRGSAELRRFTEDRIRRMRVTAVPPTDRLLVAPDGACWVERRDLAEEPWRWEFQAAFGSGSEVPPASTWDVFDPSGRYLMTVELPAGFRPHQVTEGSVTGVLASGSGVEQVVRYRRTPSG